MIRLAICDFSTGRVAGGHQDDYLTALETALQRYAVRTIAPYRDPEAGSADPHDRLARIWLGFRTFRRLLGSPEALLVLVPNPTPWDFATAFLAGIFLPSGNGRLLFVMRRNSEGIVKPGLQSRILEFMTRQMATGKRFAMVSDSRTAMRFWFGKTGRNGPIVSIPVRQAPYHERPANAPVTIGLIGAFRLEKGAIHYDGVISAALAAGPDIVVECQLSLQQKDTAGRDLATQLRTRWRDNPRVRFHSGHLDNAAFSALLYGLDLIVLPYEPARYGAGTSGLMFEALSAGRLVASTRIAWGVEEFSGNPNMVWLDGTGQQQLGAGIAKAVELVRARRATGETNQPADNTFQTSWTEAIAAITQDMEICA